MNGSNVVETVSIDDCTTKVQAIRTNASNVVAAIQCGLDEFNSIHGTKASIRDRGVTIDDRTGQLKVGLCNVGILEVFDDLQRVVSKYVDDAENEASLGEWIFGSDVNPSKFVATRPGRHPADVIASFDAPRGRFVSSDEKSGARGGSNRRCCSFCRAVAFFAILVVLVGMGWMLGFGFVVNTLDRDAFRRASEGIFGTQAVANDALPPH